MINFDTTPEDRKQITSTVKRAMKYCKNNHINYNTMDCQMDLAAVHLNDVKMDFGRLLKADDFNFVHDVFGIRNNLDRTTGKLLNCFLPRFTLKN